MQISKEKYLLACARACMNTSDIMEITKISTHTINTCISRSGSPATIGKIARALSVDVLEILAKEE